MEMGYEESLGVEWLILADAAQINGGKLYLLGGGWNKLTVNSRPASHKMAVAVSFRIPWEQTNRKHSFEIEVTDGDGNTSIAKVGGQFEVGRPPGTPQGTPQRSQIAMEMGVEFKELGTYMISASIDDEETRTFPFNVIPSPGLAAQLQKEQPPEGAGPQN